MLDLESMPSVAPIIKNRKIWNGWNRIYTTFYRWHDTSCKLRV